MTMALVAIPILLARGGIFIAVNSAVSLITVMGAIGLFATVGNTPYECFTISGIYEDRTSGLAGFDFWYLLVLLFSYSFLLVDLTTWAIRKVTKLRGSSRQSRAVASPAILSRPQ